MKGKCVICNREIIDVIIINTASDILAEYSDCEENAKGKCITCYMKARTAPAATETTAPTTTEIAPAEVTATETPAPAATETTAPTTTETTATIETTNSDKVE